MISVVRISLVLFACLFIFGGLTLMMVNGGRVDWVFAAYFVVGGTVLLIGALFEHGRYQKRDLPTEGWQPTGERFIDHASGKLIEVDYHSETGQRRYREVTSQQ